MCAMCGWLKVWTDDVIGETLEVLSPRAPPQAHPGPVPELSLLGQESVVAAGGDAENSIEFEALVGGRDVVDDEGEGGGGDSDRLTDPPASEPESEEEEEEEEEEEVLSEQGTWCAVVFEVCI